MTGAVQPAGVAAAGPGGGSSSLADVIDTILDKGVVIDAQISVTVIGIQLVNIDARVVVASVDTYLRFAEAVNRLDLAESQGVGLPEVIEGTKTNKAVGKAGEFLGDILGGGRDDEDDLAPRREKRRR